MGASGRNASGPLTSIEVCAGAGGQALGLHAAGFRHLALVEIDKYAHATLEKNVREDASWGDCEVLMEDLVGEFEPGRNMKALSQRSDSGPKGRPLKEGELDLLAGGVPCPPFSVAGQQLGQEDERDLFPRMLEIVDELKPRALMIENVRGIMDAKFDDYCAFIVDELKQKGYWFCGWHLLESRDFDVPQLRPRSILVAIRDDERIRAGLGHEDFPWPVGATASEGSLFVKLDRLMRQRRDQLVKRYPENREEIKAAYRRWRTKAKDWKGVAPTLVGGSKKHGGADLGPTRAKRAWAGLGVNAWGVADEPENGKDLVRDFLRPEGPMLTVKQAAMIQSFPEQWEFQGGKTARYRQVGNAFPPPVAEAVGRAIASVLEPARREDLLDGLEIKYLGSRRGRREFTQPGLDEVLVLPEQSAIPSPTPDLGEDLVCAGV